MSQLQQLEDRRDRALERLAAGVPYMAFIGARLERRGDELTAILKFDEKLIGNPFIPALHGGVTGGFLESAAIMQLAWDRIWADLEQGGAAAQAIAEGRFPPLPKTIDFTIDYLRAGRARDAYARAIVTKRGRRVANLRVEAWQEERDRPFASGHGHFLLAEAS